MTLHPELFTADVQMHRGSSYADEDLDSVLDWHTPHILHRDEGVLGGYLLREHDRCATLGAGGLVAVLHRRGGSPAWAKVTQDFRGAWRKMAPEDQAELLRLERDSREERSVLGPVVAKELAQRVSKVIGEDLSRFSFVDVVSIQESEDESGPRMTDDQLAFLWVLNEHFDRHGEFPPTR